MTKSNWKSGVETIFVLSVFVVLLILVAVEGETSLEFLSLEFWSVDSKGEGLRNIAFAFGTPAALLLAYLRTNSAGAQAETGVRQANLAEKRQNIDRFQSGIELMGSDDITVRIGGLTVLKQVAETDPDGYYIALQEFLIIYMQNQCALALSRLDVSKMGYAREVSLVKTPKDVEQAVQVMSGLRTDKNVEREKQLGWKPIVGNIFFNSSFLRGLNFQGLQLEGLRFEDCRLGNCVFSDTTLGFSGTRSTFFYCDFRGSRFDDLSEHKCDLTAARFLACDFRNLKNSDITLFLYANFDENCKLSGTRLVDHGYEKAARLAELKKANEQARQIASDLK